MNVFKSIFLVAGLLTGLNAVAYDFAADGIYYKINEDGTTVAVTYESSDLNSYTGSVTVPSQVTNGGVTYSVTAVADSAFNGSTDLTSVSLPSTITSLGARSFYNCSSLTSIEIPDGVTSIAKYCFRNCTNLKTVTMGNKVISIGEYAFAYCYQLSSINVSTALTEMGTYAFYNDTSLVSITFPEGTLSIDDACFRGCTNLASVSLPETLTTFGIQMFYNCTSLTSITLPKALTTMGVSAFYGCTNLTSVTLPDSLEAMSNYTFYKCSSLTSVTIPDKVTSLGTYVFYNCTSLEEITIPDKVTSIGNYAFQGCSSLKTVTMSDAVTSLGTYVFRYCVGLTSIVLSDSIKIIPNYAFQNDSNLVSVNIPLATTTINQRAFYQNFKLTSITLPENVTSLAAYAFYSCIGLKEINSLNTTPPTITTSTFNSASTSIYENATLYVPTGCKDTYAAASYWSNFTNIVEKDFTATSADYTITTAAEWNALAELMATDSLDLTGKVVKIANDIDFNGDTIKPLGYNFEPKFNGELDGQGFTISGYKAVADTAYYGALATMTGADAYIHDVTVAGDLTTTYNFAGGAVGLLYGDIDNVVNAGTVTSDGGQLIGGVIGATGTGSVVTNCCNKGTVSTNYYNAGGVMGRAYIATVKNCWNEGTVTSSYSQFGGVAGYFYGNTSGGCVVDSCYNKGSVISTGDVSAPYASGVACMVYPGEYSNCWNEGTVTSSLGLGYLSGVFGYYFGAGYGYHIVLTNCYNTSDISGTINVAGVLNYGSNSSYPTVDMYNCYNTGNITGTNGRANGIANYYTPGGTYSGCYNTGTITGTGAYTAGLFGYYRGATVADTVATTFTGCYNTGSVTSNSLSTTEYCYTGGLIGYVYRYMTVEDCYNTANVTSTGYYVGGIVAYLYGNKTSYVTNCYNTGDITSTSTNTRSTVGGIIGYSSQIDTITNVFNTGAIYAANKNYAGGIAGYCAAAITNAYNVGTVTGPAYVGGIVGNKQSSGGSLTNAYNTGTVTATTDGTSYLGAITGGNSTAILSNTYYLSTVATGSAYDTTSVSVTAAELAKLDLGDDWTAGDNYTYPRLTSVDVDAAKAYAVQVFPADGDSIGNITQGFYVGAIDGVTWTASPSYVEVSDNNATFTQVYTGTLTMTATAGDYAVDTELTCNVTTVGISEVASDEAREVVAEKFYTVSGQQVAEPTEGARAIYIVVKTYDDGTTEAVKEVR